MKLTFILSHNPNPRMNKRVNQAKEKHEVSLILWDKMTLNLWENKHENLDAFIFRIRANYTNPLRRIKETLKFTKAAISTLKRINPDIIYCENIDMLNIAYQYKSRFNKSIKIIYEIADLHRYVSGKSKNPLKIIIKRFLIKKEKIMCKIVDKMVLTSEKFYTNYYINIFPKAQTYIVNNIPNPIYFQKYSRKTGGTFTVGFIGTIRYEKQMKMLIDCSRILNINVLFAGAGLNNEVRIYGSRMSNIKFLGKFDYEKEVASLYSLVDCVFAVYDTHLTNVRLALPNKLFEAILCKLPIIVSKNTFLEEIVIENGLGISVDPCDINDLIKALHKLSTDMNFVEEVRINCEKAQIKFNYFDEEKKQRELFIFEKEDRT